MVRKKKKLSFKPPPPPPVASSKASVPNLVSHGCSLPSKDSATVEIPTDPASKLLLSTPVASTSKVVGSVTKTPLLRSTKLSSKVDVDSVSPDLPVSSSWCDTVKGGSSAITKCGSPFKLETGEHCVVIPNKVIEESKPLWKDFVVGQFYRDPPSFGKIKALVNLLWSKWQRDITVTKLDSENSYLFKIPNISARQRVVREGIWSIDGSTMFVAPWIPGVKPSKPALKKLQFGSN
ncbi:hypothetical protein V5N11_017528 [Cardamine amara subsp. amara]|uniref:DUF4283 domain-containing protein n=1 Tax=Cardamine amara subsp. amara TaxID=228776 RepID=A0ABD0ZG28_CARAN